MNQYQREHEYLVEMINSFFERSYFEIKESIISVDKIAFSFNMQDINNLATIAARLLNLYEVSGSNFDLFELLQTYLLNPEKRLKINEIIKGS